MTGSAGLRAAAAEVVGAVLDGHSLEAALPSNLARLKEPRGGAQVQALVYGSVRWFFRLNGLLGELLDRPLKARDRRLHGLLLVGLFDLAYGHTPQHAVVAETVNAVEFIGHPKARGLVNAVMRRFLRERDALEAKIDGIAHLRDAHPSWLHNALKKDWPNNWQSAVAGNNAHPPMWLRVNSRRQESAAYRAQLSEALDMQVVAHPFASEALCPEKPVPVTDLPGFAEGDVSVQDAAAQLAAHLLDVKPGQRILDACAAPGGKTAHIAELSDCLAQIVALDVSGERLGRVSENLERLQLEGVQIVEGDALLPSGWWDGALFDRILVDAPCSATGVIRRHPDIRILRRESDLQPLARKQMEILSALWPLLKPGGRLLYATCSILKSENESVVTRFLQEQGDAKSLKLAEQLPGRAVNPGQQILPGETGMDGFYYAYLEKQG